MCVFGDLDVFAVFESGCLWEDNSRDCVRLTMLRKVRSCFYEGDEDGIRCCVEEMVGAWVDVCLKRLCSLLPASVYSAAVTCHL